MPSKSGRRPLRTFAITSLLAALSACGSSSPEPETYSPRSDFLVTGQLDREIVTHPSATVEIPEADLTIRFGALDDSRCPTKALIQCVWAGSVKISLLVASISGGRRYEPFPIETVAGKDVVTFAGKRIRLVRVMPEKETTDAIPPAQYRIVLQVTRGG